MRFGVSLSVLFLVLVVHPSRCQGERPISSKICVLAIRVKLLYWRESLRMIAAYFIIPGDTMRLIDACLCSVSGLLSLPRNGGAEASARRCGLRGEPTNIPLWTLGDRLLP